MNNEIFDVIGICENFIKGDKKKNIKENMDEICEALEKEIIKEESVDEVKESMLKKLRKFCNTNTNIMLVGATGCGKSSTINALFGLGKESKRDNNEDSDNDYIEIAKVGSKVILKRRI